MTVMSPDANAFIPDFETGSNRVATAWSMACADVWRESPRITLEMRLSNSMELDGTPYVCSGIARFAAPETAWRT